MTTTNDNATVTALRRPPINVSTLVRSSRDHTFDMFVCTIGVWWPAQPASSGRDRVRDITIERRIGGKVFERWDDDTTVDASIDTNMPSSRPVSASSTWRCDIRGFSTAVEMDMDSFAFAGELPRG